MSDILAKIADYKRHEIEERKVRHPLADVERAARSAPAPRGFHDALVAGFEKRGMGLIAEIKKASPSKGLIRSDFEPAELARAYEKGGADCLSILTDTPSFQGKDADLTLARNAVGLPALRKDFMLETYQVVEARALSADCILVILAMVSDIQARELIATARGFGMDAILEVHDEDEMTRALKLDSPLIGINNRNLKNFITDLAVAERLAPMVGDEKFIVAESGIFEPADVVRLKAAGARAILVGEHLMRAADVEDATRTLLNFR